MLRLQTCTSCFCVLLLTACGGGGGTTVGTDGASDSTGSTSATSATSSSGSTSSTSSSDGTGTTTPTTSSASASASTTDVSTTETTTVADTGELTGTSGTGVGSTSGETGDLPGGACRSDADCADGFEVCFAPGEQNCGACQAPDAPCFDDLNCDFGLVCLPFVAACACNPGEGQCVPVCEPGGCGPEATCNARTGACEPFTCSGDNVVCPAHFDCVPGSGGDDCVRHPCGDDGDCGGTPCVEGGCHAGFGICMPPAP